MSWCQLNRLQALALGIVICMGLMSCTGSKVSQENFDKIHTGMSLAEVQAILGEPTESSSVDVAVFSGSVSKWQHGEATITIQFVNGKVVAKQFSKTGQK